MSTTAISGHRTESTLDKLGYRALATGAVLVAIWVAATLAAIYSPDLVSGSNHDHIQLAMFFVWPLAAVATGMVLLAAGVSRHEGTEPGPWAVFAAVTAIAWIGAALGSIFVSPMVTGTDPTTIPLAALIAPVFAVLVTAYACIYVAGAGAKPITRTR